MLGFAGRAHALAGVRVESCNLLGRFLKKSLKTPTRDVHAGLVEYLAALRAQPADR
jgi:hypothetical protein